MGRIISHAGMRPGQTPPGNQATMTLGLETKDESALPRGLSAVGNLALLERINSRGG